ncbi:MAG: ABC transporter ATP-binding protein [Planctomycetaceae bacterium]|nr:ABC transporter ATP-binding protein [Planctomycetaceae bacterium]
MANAEHVIQVEGLKKTYRSGILGRRTLQALQGVDLQVPQGSIYGLLGPNGAGKTTLIKILLGIVRKSSGGATVLGLPAGKPAARRRIGYLPENHRIPRHLTGRTALEYYGALSGLAVGEVRRRMPELLDRVGLLGREKERVSGYSKGMQQRLGLAQAMLHKPDLIVLDEPTDGVDPVGRKEIREVLRNLASEGATIFLNSHLLQEIELVCEQVAILTKGVVRRTGSVAELTSAMEEAPMVFDLHGATPETVAGCFSGHHKLETAPGRDGLVYGRALIKEQSELDAVVDALRAAHVSIVSMKRRELTLEEAFLDIVKEEN